MPLITELIEVLPKVTQELLPKAKEPLRKMLNVLAKPEIKGNAVAVERAARKGGELLDADQWALWREISPQISAAAKVKQQGGSMLDGYLGYMEESMRENSQLAIRGRQAYNMGKDKKLPVFPEIELPANLADLEAHGSYLRINRELKKAKKLGDTKGIEKLKGELEILQRIRPEESRQIENMPWYIKYFPGGPKPKLQAVMGIDNPVMDKAAVDAFMAGTRKSFMDWWYGLTGSKGPGKGFVDLTLDKNWKKDFNLLNDKLAPWLERYYGTMDKIGKLERNLIKFQDNAKQVAKINKAIEQLTPLAKQDFTKILTEYLPVAKKYFSRPGTAGADMRIALWREGPAFKKMVEPYMEAGEKEVAEAHKALMTEARSQAERRGIPVLDIDQEYVHHSLRHLKGSTRWGGISPRENAQIEKLASRISPFVHRNYGSLPMFPSIHGSTKGYIGTVARRIGMTDLKKKWWDMLYGKDAPLAEFPETHKYVEKYLKQYEQNLFNDSWWEKAAHHGTMWMYATKVWGTASAPFKHTLKMVRILSTHPYDAVRTLPKATKAGVQLALQGFGVKPGKEALLIRNFTAARSFFEEMSGIRGGSPFSKNFWEQLKHGKTDPLIDLANQIGNAGIGSVEMVERAWTVLIALSKAQRKGLSMQDAMRGMWSTILTNNFLGAADRPLWMSKSWQQFAAPFIYTALRVTEETIGMVLNSLPKKVITGMGEDALKLAWRMPRDAFGTPYIKHLLMFTSATIGLEAYARAHDTSLWGIIAAHIPAIRPSATGPRIGIPPVQLYDDFRDRGGTTEALTSAIFDFLTSTPTLDKIVQQQRGTASKIYGGEPWRAYLSLPSQKAIKEMQERAAQRAVGMAPHTARWRAEKQRLERSFWGRFYPVIHPKAKGEPWKFGFPKP